MEINWFTVIAQIINFLVLVLLLKRFLYGPVIKTMDERQERIASQEKEAQEKIHLAEKETAEFKQRVDELDKAKEEVIKDSRKKAKDEHKEYLKQAKSEVEAMKDKWEASFHQEKDLYIHELRQQIVRESCSLTRRVLLDLADAELEKLIIDVFIDKINKLDTKQLKKINERLSQAEEKIRIFTAFEILDEDRSQMEKVIKKKIKQVKEVQFEVTADLICGIELEIKGYRLGWSIDDYLNTFQENLLQALTEKQAMDMD